MTETNDEVTCKVCRLGEIIQDAYQDYHCNVCGLRYKFLPLRELSPSKSSDSVIQVQPGLFVARRSASVFKKTD